MKTQLAAVIVGVLMALPAFAQTRADQREVNQQERIGEGVESGQLTPKEGARLERREARVDASIEKDKADGRGFTPKEKAKAERKQDRASAAIAKQKHDAQAR